MPIVHSSGTSFELIEGAHEIIDSLLIPADDLNAEHAQTVKYYVESYPDLFVRVNPYESVRPAMIAGDRLGNYGVEVLPYHIVEYRDQEWVITKRVTGLNLEEALAQEEDKYKVLKAADKTWAGLATHLMAAKKYGFSIPSDIERPYQYMFGSIDLRSPNRAIYLVDLPQFIEPIDDSSASPAGYAEELLSIANGLIDVESAANSRAEAAREMVGLAVGGIDMGSEWNRQLAFATKFVLNNCAGLNHIDDEEFIMGLTQK